MLLGLFPKPVTCLSDALQELDKASMRQMPTHLDVNMRELDFTMPSKISRGIRWRMSCAGTVFTPETPWK